MASRRILRKAGKALRKDGGCAPLAGSILGSRSSQKRKAKRTVACRSRRGRKG
jgi:hypothetical protein